VTGVTRGVGAAVRARAPIRLDLAGGWTDVPPFSAREGGAVVNVAINRYCHVTARRRDRGMAVYSADFDERAEAAAAEELPSGGGLALLRASLLVAQEETGVLEHGGTGHQGGGDGTHPGIELWVRCDAPPGSGTGSSASVGVAVAGAIAACRGRPVAAHEAALRAIRAEREHLRVAGGTQDQFAAAHGGASYMSFRGPVAHVSPLRLAPATVAELEKRLVLVYTGVSRVSGSVVANVMGAYEAGVPRTVAALRTLRRLADDLKSALLRGDADALGGVLADNWRCQKDLHESVTSAAIDRLYERALAAGALGGKALGAGGGGCLLFLAAPDREHELRAALTAHGAQPLDFSFEWGGLQAWFPAGGNQLPSTIV
jgi:D-glycero-alpha-D-manno-heptose-7-phosphate kinase